MSDTSTNASERRGSEEEAPTALAPRARDGEGPGGRLLPGVLLTALLPLAILLDTGIALARGWPVKSRLDLGIIFLAALALLGVFVLLLIPRYRKALRRRWPQLALATAAGLGTWLVLEAALAFVVVRGDRDWSHRRKPAMQAVFHPTPERMP